MARSKFNLPVFTFTGGKRSDQGPFIGENNAAQVLNNFELLRDGSVRKRYGIDYEDGHITPSDLTRAQARYDEAPIGKYVWHNVEGDANKTFLVLQSGYTLYFFDASTDSTSQKLLDSIDISRYVTDKSQPTGKLTFSDGKGTLLVAGEYLEPIFIEAREITARHANTVFRDFTEYYLTRTYGDFDWSQYETYELGYLVGGVTSQSRAGNVYSDAVSTNISGALLYFRDTSNGPFAPLIPALQEPISPEFLNTFKPIIEDKAFTPDNGGGYYNIYGVSAFDLGNWIIPPLWAIDEFSAEWYLLAADWNAAVAAGERTRINAGVTAAFSAFPVNIKIRDFEGAPDYEGLSRRPSRLTAMHNYNLRNQGWPRKHQLYDGGVGVTTGLKGAQTDPVKWSFERINKYPSNSDRIYFYIQDVADVRTPTGDGAVLENIGDIGSFNPLLMRGAKNGRLLHGVPPSKGHFIIDPFVRDRERVMKDEEHVDRDDRPIAGLNSSCPDFGGRDANARRPVATAFFSGRAFWAGAANKYTNTTVFYSRLIQNLREDIGVCYQRNDPTTEDLNELLPTDGGTFEVPTAGQIYHLAPVGSALVIVASGGIWAVNTSPESGFTAQSHSIQKLSDEGCIPGSPIVAAEGSVYYLGYTGIIKITADPVQGQPAVVDITKDRIQTDYESIPTISRVRADTFYDESNRRIYWLYSSTEQTTQKYRYDKALILDLNFKDPAFYDYTFADLDANSPFVVGGFLDASLAINESDNDVTLNDDTTVVTAYGEAQTRQVTITNTLSGSGTYTLEDITVDIDDSTSPASAADTAAIIIQAINQGGVLKDSAYVKYVLSDGGDGYIIYYKYEQGVISPTISTTTNVTDSGTYPAWNNEIYDAGSEQDITIVVRTTRPRAAQVKLITLIPDAGNYNVTFSEFRDGTNFVDWSTADEVAATGTGTGYKANVLTNWDINVGIGSTGAPIRMANKRKQTTKVTTHFNQTETGYDDAGNLINESSCMLRTRWDNGTTASGRWSEQKEAYRLNYNYINDIPGDFTYPFDVITTTNRVRGHGRALQLDFESPEGYNCEILGWEPMQAVGQTVK